MQRNAWYGVCVAVVISIPWWIGLYIVYKWIVNAIK